MTETFAPESNGWTLQREFTITPEWQVAEDERELGNINSTAIAWKPRRVFSLEYKAITRAASEYMRSFFNRLVGPAARFSFTLPEYVPTPDTGPTLEAVSGGTQGLRTILCGYTWQNANGQTLASASSSLQVPANDLLKVTLPPYPPSVTQAVIYATEGAAGTEQEQVTLTNTRTWTQPDAALLLATNDVPAANTATETITAKIRFGSYSLTRGIGTSYRARMVIEETY